MSPGRLNGHPTRRGPLRVGEVRRGRFPEEHDADVYAGAEARPAIRLKLFAGRPAAHVRPWIEADVERSDEGFMAELVAALAALLPPGGYLMLGYGGDETERGLRRRFPPAATPLGKALLDAGCTWFKDWYYPEGWLEGGFKLQGNLPASEGDRAAGLHARLAELEAWLTATAGEGDELLERARRRAHAALGRAATSTDRR